MPNELSYFSENQVNDNVYSVDNLVICFTITEAFFKMFITKEFKAANIHGDLQTDKTKSYYRREYVYAYGVGKLHMKTMKFTNDEIITCKIDCNPNKCFIDNNCINDIKSLLSNSLWFWLSRLDIAIDIPICYKDVYPITGKKFFHYVGTSNHPTLYFGKKRNKPGRVKIYDKAYESKLYIDLTRVEITLGNPLKDKWESELNNAIPTIYLQCPDKEYLTDSKLSSTDRVLISLLRESAKKVEEFSQLDYKKKKKIKPYIFCEKCKIDFDQAVIKDLALNIYGVIEPNDFCVQDKKYIPIMK